MYAAITAVARRLGMTPETLRKWIRQAAVDEGQAPGGTTDWLCQPDSAPPESVFARMSRYGPAAAGTRRQRITWVAAQSGR